MALPDFRYELYSGSMLVQLIVQQGEIHITMADLHSFTIYSLGIDYVQMDSMRQNFLEECAEIPLIIVAGHHGV